MNELYAYTYWDGSFHKLLFSRSENLGVGFVRTPAYDTTELEKSKDWVVDKQQHDNNCKHIILGRKNERS